MIEPSGNVVYACYRRLRHGIRERLGLYRPFLPLLRLRETTRSYLVSRSSEIVIEGFPRSATSFAHFAFLIAQDRAVSVAHHTHMPAQVALGVHYKIPTLMLIREPTGAVKSLKILHPYLPMETLLEDYIRFYSSILHCRQGFVIAPFHLVTEDFGRVIRSVNERFGTRFAEFAHTDSNVRKCFRAIEEQHIRIYGPDSADELRVARPSGEKKSIQERLTRDLETEQAQRLGRTAEALYRDYVGPEASGDL
jgi:hypothetical protein